MTSRVRYRFTGRFTSMSGTPHYSWEARLPNDSRVDRVTCPAGWFWGEDEPVVVNQSTRLDWIDDFFSDPCSELEALKQRVATEVSVAEIRGWARAVRALENADTYEMDMAASHLGRVQLKWLDRS